MPQIGGNHVSWCSSNLNFYIRLMSIPERIATATSSQHTRKDLIVIDFLFGLVFNLISITVKAAKNIILLHKVNQILSSANILESKLIIL